MMPIDPDNIGSYISADGKIIETKAYQSARFNNSDRIKDSDVKTGESLKTSEVIGTAYEVIRVIRQIPMYFEDHCDRLQKSLEKLDVAVKTGEWPLKKELLELIRANGETDCNVKISAFAVMKDITGGGKVQAVTRMLNVNRSFYPPAHYYENGISCGTLAHTRSNPNAKRVVTGFKERMGQLMKSGGFFEILLYDGDERLTEGSRSNLFFSQGGKICTAPDDMILKGTIRKYVFFAAKSQDILLDERPVTLSELRLGKVDGAFLTGTSIGVLPIHRVDDTILNSVKDPLIRLIRQEYEKIANDYINSHK